MDEIAPVVLGFDCGDEIECIGRKGQLRDGGLCDFDAASVDEFRVFCAGCGYAALCVVDAVDIAFRSECCEFLDGPSAPAADIEGSEALFDMNVLQPPAGKRGMGLVHHPENEPAAPFGGLSHLLQGIDGSGSGEQNTS